MKLNRIFIAILAIAGMTTACQTQIKEITQPVEVDRLVSPRNNLSVNFKNLETLTFEWEATEWKGQGQPSYELVFDKEGGNFSNPVYKVASDVCAIDLSADQIREIHSALANGSETATAEWSVYAISGEDKILSTVTRKVTFDAGQIPAVVKSLYAPSKGSNYNVYDIDAPVKFRWSEAEWDGDGEVTYELVFELDNAEAPLMTLPAQSTSLEVTPEQLTELYNEASVDGADVRLVWYVNAVAGGKTTGSVTSSYIVLQYIEGKKFKVGGDLYIGGEGSEDGQKFTYITADYYDTSLSTYGDNFAVDMPYYEIHTSLKAGKNYYFYGLDGEEKLYVSAVDFSPVPDAPRAVAKAAEDGVYRLRINTVTNEITMQKIESFYFFHLWMKYKGELEYQGRGVWSITDFFCKVDWDNGNWCDDRYKFVMEFAGSDKVQHYGADHNIDNRQDNHETAAEGYFDIQMTATSDWDGKFKIPGNYHRKYADITVYLNDDKGHYTHEYTNVTDQEPAKFEVGDDLYIGGTAAEAGQKFTFVTENYYDTSVSTYGDNYAVDMPYYEIHTKLLAGMDYYFYAVDGTEEVYVSANDFSTKEDAASASTRVDETGLYRIRINTATGEVTALKIERFYFYHLMMKYKSELEYQGNGVWALDNFFCKVDWDNGGWCDERYRFVMEFAGNLAQDYGANHNIDDRQGNHNSAPEGYFDIQMTEKSDWDGKFKIPGDYHRKYATLTVFLNDAKGHYTHEYTNIHEAVEIPEFTNGSDLFIGGLGSEEGQKFTYVTADYYDTSVNTYGDNYSVDMPYYEIHTKLEAGAAYYFYGLDGSAKLYKSAVDFAQTNSSSEASATVDETGVYRIRINTTTGEITAMRIERMYFLHLWREYQVDFDYVGKGVWAQTFKFDVDNEDGGWCDDRYKFVVKFAGHDDVQHYGANHNDDNRHNNHASAPDGYFDIQMTATSKWDGKFKVPGDYHRKTGKMTVYLNEDKGHYTHEYSEIQ